MKKKFEFGEIVVIILSIVLIFSLISVLFLVIIGQVNISEGLLIALFTIVFGGLTFLIERRNEARKLTYESRKKVYEELLQPFIEGMIAVQLKQKIDEKDLTKKMTEIGVKLAIYGSDEVINKFEKFRDFGKKPLENKYDILIAFAKLILAIRKDSGFSNTTIDEKKILKMFITDYDKNKDKFESLLK
jgi:hypothetical protein